MNAHAKHHILVVEDDPVSRMLLEEYFRKEGFSVSLAENGAGMKSVLRAGHVDLILLDINLADRDDGLDLTREIRAQSDIGIILVTSRSSDIDRIVGLELGADDYVVKPFNERELLARVKGLLRRLQHVPVATAEEGKGYRFNDWRLMVETRQLRSPENEVVEITHGEFMLLLAFLKRPGWVLNRDQLMDAVSSREWLPSDRTIDVMVGRLRRKLEENPSQPKLLRTVHGAGYQLMAKVVREG